MIINMWSFWVLDLPGKYLVTYFNVTSFIKELGW